MSIWRDFFGYARDALKHGLRGQCERCKFWEPIDKMVRRDGKLLCRPCAKQQGEQDDG